MDEQVADAVAGAVVAEIGWREADGQVRLAARTPLVRDGVPTLALTYDDAALAERLADADAVMLAVSDARHALRGWQPLTVPVDVTVTHDPDGDAFLDDCVGQELRKYPPARLRADSLLQRREHWWYVARVLVTLRPAGAATTLAARDHADSGVLCWGAEGALDVATVSVDDWAGRRVRLRTLDRRGLGERGRQPAALLRHDFSVDLERRATMTITGWLDGDTLAATERQGQPTLSPPAGVLRRIRDARAFERACRRAIPS